MLIKPVSDLHLEFSDFDVPHDGADVLILAGDVLVAKYLQYPAIGLGVVFQEFLARVSDTFEHVIYVAGNHEFYKGYLNKSYNLMREEADKHGNIHILQNSIKKIGDVTFIGGTLWTDFHNNDPLVQYYAKDNMSDYRMITIDRENGSYGGLRPHDVYMEHVKTATFIYHSLKAYDNCVVVTHHAPTLQAIKQEHWSNYFSGLNYAYASDLEHLMLSEDAPKYWIHGHTHHSHVVPIGNTTVVANCRGYQNETYNESTGFNPHLILEV